MSKKKWFKITEGESKDRVGTVSLTNINTEAVNIRISVSKNKKDRKKNLYLVTRLDSRQELVLCTLYVAKGEKVWFRVKKDCISGISVKLQTVSN